MESFFWHGQSDSQDCFKHGFWEVILKMLLILQASDPKADPELMGPDCKSQVTFILEPGSTGNSHKIPETTLCLWGGPGIQQYG